MTYSKLRCFLSDHPTACFIAIYSDLSGCNIFYRKGNEYASTCLDPDETVDADWFIDASYLYFVAIPPECKKEIEKLL